MKKPLVIVLLVFLVVNLAIVGYFFGPRILKNEEEKNKAFLCPVPAEYCPSGRVVEVNGAYLGVGYQVPGGTPVLAVISGLADDYGANFIDGIGGGHYPGIELSSRDSDLVVDYVRIGDPFTILADYDQGGEIITTGSGEIASFGVNLLVTVSENNEVLKLGPDDFYY